MILHGGQEQQQDISCLVYLLQTSDRDDLISSELEACVTKVSWGKYRNKRNRRQASSVFMWGALWAHRWLICMFTRLDRSHVSERRRGNDILSQVAARLVRLWQKIGRSLQSPFMFVFMYARQKSKIFRAPNSLTHTLLYSHQYIHPLDGKHLHISLWNNSNIFLCSAAEAQRFH